MVAILLKNVPEELKARIKDRATLNRRSMSQEILVMLEQASRTVPHILPSTPVKTKRPYTHQWLMKVIRDGRK